MSGRVPEHIVQQIARSADLVRIIGRHCNLKQRGKSFWGLCPFHKEKTPSFKVDPDSGLYYCFGCKEAGNVFTFLRKVDGLEFQEALERLARDAGVDLSQYRTQEGSSRGELDELREVTELATAFYAKCLQKAKGAQRARDYLSERRITDESVERWRLGYAPEGWDHLLRFARGRKRDARLLEAAGLVIRRSEVEGHYDRFRNRLMFPIADPSGRSIGFGARALSEEEEAKYLNSPEGPLFDKGRCFYGLCQAREAIRTDKAAVIVEGYTDVIMAHQFGVEPVMAVLGTALTEEHARTLRRLCETVILVFDADEAGQASATRSVELLLGEDLDVRVARLEAGTDPCEFLLAHGADAFRTKLRESEDFLEFRLRRARQVYDTSTVTGRARAFDDLARLAIRVTNDARRDMLIRTLAEDLGLSIQSAMARVGHVWSQGRDTGESTREEPVRGRVRSADETALFELAGFLLVHEQFQPRVWGRLDTGRFTESPEKTLLGLLLDRCRRDGPVQKEDFVHSLEDPELTSRAVAAIEEEYERGKVISNLGPQERCDRYLQEMACRAEEQALEQLRLAITTEAPATTTTIEAPGGLEKDKELREYMSRRMEQDRKSASINPRKERE